MNYDRLGNISPWIECAQESLNSTEYLTYNDYLKSIEIKFVSTPITWWILVTHIITVSITHLILSPYSPLSSVRLSFSNMCWYRGIPYPLINPPAVLSIRFLTLQLILCPFFLRDDELFSWAECEETLSAQYTIHNPTWCMLLNTKAPPF